MRLLKDRDDVLPGLFREWDRPFRRRTGTGGSPRRLSGQGWLRGVSRYHWRAMHAIGARIEVVSNEMAAVLRLKTGAERLAIASGMFSSARRMLLSHLRSEHPEWDEHALHREAARRLSHGAV